MKIAVDRQLNQGLTSNRVSDLEATQVVHRVTTGLVISVMSSIGLGIGAEVVTVFVGVLPGVILYGALLIAFVSISYLARDTQARQIFLALTLLPLLRILSLTLIIPRLLPFLQYALTGIPILVTALVVSRVGHLGMLGSHLTRTERLWQFAFALSGIPLGIAASNFLQAPIQFIHSSSPLMTVLVWISLTLFGSVTEEIVFRGVLQKALSPAFGFAGIVLISLLYASLFMGTMSFAAVIFYLLMSLLFGFWAKVTNSIAGPIFAHVILNLVVLAFLLVL